MQISAKNKLLILIALTVIMGVIYSIVGIDFEIFQYQFSSRLRKLILMILVGGAIAASVVIFQAITTNRLLTPSIMGLDAVYMFVKVFVSFCFWCAICISYESVSQFYNYFGRHGGIFVTTFPRYI